VLQANVFYMDRAISCQAAFTSYEAATLQFPVPANGQPPLGSVSDAILMRYAVDASGAFVNMEYTAAVTATITRSDAARLAGTFAGTFTGGSRLEGSFDAPTSCQ
jgi:hypothetical protein